MSHAVREATADDADDVVRLLDAAMLEFDPEEVHCRIEAGTVLVAVVERYRDADDGTDTVDDGDREGSHDETPEPPSTNDRVVGACVLVEGEAEHSSIRATEIVQIAVHRSRRGRGIGTALVGAAASRLFGPLVARFREQVRPFYESLGFEIRERRGSGSDDPGVDSDDDPDDPEADSDGSSDDAAADRLFGVLAPSEERL